MEYTLEFYKNLLDNITEGIYFVDLDFIIKVTIFKLLIHLYLISWVNLTQGSFLLTRCMGENDQLSKINGIF